MSALYSGIETGVYTLNRVRLNVRAGHGDRRAMRLRRELRRPNRLLSTLLIGTNASSYVASFAIAAMLHDLGLGDWELIALEAAIFTPILFVFAETLPKDLFRTHTDRWTYGLSGLLPSSRALFMLTGLLPVVHGLGGLVSRLFGGGPQAALSARQRISQLIKEGVGSGVLTEMQTTLADRALAMGGRTVSTEMIPWNRAVAIPHGAERRQRETLIRRNFTRMPVVDDAGRVVGILASLDALLAPDRPTGDLMIEPITFRPDTPVRDALRTMRAARRKMAVVVESDGARPQGLVTLKDIVEPVTGELGAW
jgi:CBS domain containing-hemolysin-like protein